MAGMGQTSAAVPCPACGMTILLRFALRMTGWRAETATAIVAAELIGTPIEDHRAAEHWDEVVQDILLADL